MSKYGTIFFNMYIQSNKDLEKKSFFASCSSNLAGFNGRNFQELSADIGGDSERQKLKIEIPKK